MNFNYNIKNIIGRYCMINKRNVRINKNELINNLDEIIYIVNNYTLMWSKCNCTIANYQRFNHKYKVCNCNVMDLLVKNIKIY